MQLPRFNFVRLIVVSAILGALTTGALVGVALLVIAALAAVGTATLVGIAIGVVWMVATGMIVVTLEGRREGNA